MHNQKYAEHDMFMINMHGNRRRYSNRPQKVVEMSEKGVVGRPWKIVLIARCLWWKWMTIDHWPAGEEAQYGGDNSQSNKTIIGKLSLSLSYCPALSFVCWHSLWTWHGYLEKKLDMAFSGNTGNWTKSLLLHRGCHHQLNSTNRNPNINKLRWAINYIYYHHEN